MENITMAHYQHTLTNASSLYSNLDIRYPISTAISLFPKLLDKFDFDIIAVPPHDCHIDLQSINIVLPITFNPKTHGNPQVEFHVSLHRAEDWELPEGVPLRINNRGRVDTVNINTSKDFPWTTDHLLNKVHGGLNFLTTFQELVGKEVRHIHREAANSFITHLHDIYEGDRHYVISLEIAFSKCAFSIRPR